MSVAAPQPSPLAVAALALVGDGVSAPQLVERFADVDAEIDARTATRLLHELARLGLARAGRKRGTASETRLTPLGERLLDASFTSRTDYADLLAELERMRTDLLSTIAHELRTPLTSVRTSVGLLLDPAVEPSPEQRRELLETIDRNATRMQRLVGDILDLSRFRTGAVHLQSRRFDAVELARAAIASVGPLLVARDQAIDLEAPLRPVWVFGDYRRLEQALVNLLSNAHKWSPDGARIRVSVSTAEGEVRWVVRDDGPGIRPEDQARLFERFFVGRRDRSEAGAGVGLGLPIVLAITEAHGGRVDVSSRPGHGSRFSIVVPAVAPDQGASE